MIKGKKRESRIYVTKPILNYRKIDALNQSMIKLFDSDPVKFYQEFKLGRKINSKKNTSATIGDLVHFYILDCHGDDLEFENRFDEKFALYDQIKGSGQVFILADTLFTLTESCLDENNSPTIDFETRFSEACQIVQRENFYKNKKEDQILQDFINNGQQYFDLKLANIGKTVVDISLLDKSKIVAKNILEDPLTSHIFLHDDDKEVINHVPIEWKYKIGDDKYIDCKGEVDRIEIDHSKKQIQPDDIKTTYDNESFDYVYIKNSHYLQNAFYVLAVNAWKEKFSHLKDYTVLPMRFIVGDTSYNNRRPIVYKTSDKDVEYGINGFKLRGIKYRGISELIEEMMWCESNDMWNCSKEVFESNGVINLKIDYD